jgi:hypothetical protein
MYKWTKITYTLKALKYKTIILQNNEWRAAIKLLKKKSFTIDKKAITFDK